MFLGVWETRLAGIEAHVMSLPQRGIGFSLVIR
jgi:hypothetical protein